MLLKPEELKQIAARTLAHYDQHAQAFWDGTRDHDVSQNIAALLAVRRGGVTIRAARFRMRIRARSEDVQSARPSRDRPRGIAAVGGPGPSAQRLRSSRT